MTVRLVASNGAVVKVADEKAERLLRQGFARPEVPKKAPAKKSASSKSDK